MALVIKGEEKRTNLNVYRRMIKYIIIYPYDITHYYYYKCRCSHREKIGKKLQNVHQGYVLELGLPVIYFLFYFFKIYLFGSTGS